MSCLKSYCFVNNVKKISIAAVNERGELINNYSVQVVMSQDEARKREEFSRYVKEIGKQVKGKEDSSCKRKV